MEYDWVMYFMIQNEIVCLVFECLFQIIDPDSIKDGDI